MLLALSYCLLTQLGMVSISCLGNVNTKECAPFLHPRVGEPWGAGSGRKHDYRSAGVCSPKTTYPTQVTMRFWRMGALLAATFLCQLLPALASNFMGVWCTHTHRKVSPMTERISLSEWLGHLKVILGYVLWKRVCFECCFFSSKSKSDPSGDSGRWASKVNPAANSLLLPVPAHLPSNRAGRRSGSTGR